MGRRAFGVPVVDVPRKQGRTAIHAGKQCRRLFAAALQRHRKTGREHEGSVVTPEWLLYSLQGKIMMHKT